MQEVTLLRDLAVVMALGGAVTAIFHRLRQPVVLGYILAGVLIGPHTPPFAFIRDQHSIETLAELGVILLLFSIGLEFSLRKLRRVGGVAVIGAGLEIPLMIWVGYSVGRIAGWGTMDSLFLGAILSISSTTIIVKVLMELDLTRADFARIIMGILIAEDVAAILILVILSGFASAGGVDLGDLLFALAKVVLFVVSVTLVGLLTLPSLLHALARVRAHEVLTTSVLGICFGTAVLGGELGFSVALGAFLVGAVMAETREVHKITERIEPIRDVFSAMFFVAVGLSIDPRILLAQWHLVLLLSAVVIVGKIASCSFATIVAGYSPRTAFRVGMGLAQIGEFSFIIANLGRSAGVVSDFVYPITVAVSAVTTLVTPYLIRAADPTAGWLAPRMPARLEAFFAFYDRRLGRWKGRRSFGLPPEAKWPAVRFTLAGALVLALLLVARSLATAARGDGG
ncbi:MAG: cation:proton antiporter, partial [Candidatus Binatia bacterium]